MKRPKPKFKIGQVVRVDGRAFDWIKSRRYHPEYLGDGEIVGWWYKCRYPGDCEEFHESLLRALTKKETGK